MRVAHVPKDGFVFAFDFLLQFVKVCFTLLLGFETREIHVGLVERLADNLGVGEAFFYIANGAPIELLRLAVAKTKWRVAVGGRKGRGDVEGVAIIKRNRLVKRKGLRITAEGGGDGEKEYERETFQQKSGLELMKSRGLQEEESVASVKFMVGLDRDELPLYGDVTLDALITLPQIACQKFIGTRGSTRGEELIALVDGCRFQ